MLEYNTFFAVYIAITVFGCSLCILQKISNIKITNKFVLVLIVATSILMCFKPETLKDCSAYKHAYFASQRYSFSLSDFSIGARFEKMEVLFVFIMKLFYSAGINIKIFWGVCALFTYMTSYYGFRLCYYENENKFNSQQLNLFKYKKTCDPGIVMWSIYLLFCGLHYGAIALRAGLALGFGILSIGILLRYDNKIIALILGVLAVLFQTSILVMLIIVVLYKFLPKLDKKKCLIITIVLLILLLLNAGAIPIATILTLITIVLQKYNISGFWGYLNSYDNEVGLKDYYMVILFGFFLFLCNDKIKDIQKYKFIVMVGLFVITFLYPIRAIDRIYDMFLIFSVPMLAYNLHEYKKNTLDKIVMIATIPFLFVPQWIICY